MRLKGHGIEISICCFSPKVSMRMGRYNKTFSAFNDPKSEFVYKDAFIYIIRCPREMVAHPFALNKLKGVDRDKAFAWNHTLCEAGKGFAVVANEIKGLAKQTAAASGEIKQQIEGIQTSTQGTVTEISCIATVVGQVNELVSTIAEAVEEQSVNTQDIAGNVASASQGAGEVNATIAEGSKAANSIAADIADVTQAADEMTNASSQVTASSSELSELADKLNTMVKQFTV